MSRRLRMSLPMWEALVALAHPRVVDHVTHEVSIAQQTGEALVRRGLATRHQYSTYLPTYRITPAGREMVK